MIRVLIIPAFEASPLEAFDTFAAAFGRPPRQPRNRTGEAEYLAAINAHWKASKAKSDAITRRDGESAVDHLIRKLEPLYAHDDWRREQARLWANGTWVAPEQRKEAA